MTDNKNRLNIEQVLEERGWIRHPGSLHWLAPVQEVPPEGAVEGAAIGHCYCMGWLASHDSAYIPIGSDAIPKSHRHKQWGGEYCLAYVFKPFKAATTKNANHPRRTNHGR